MHIAIQRHSDRGMTEKHAYGFCVRAAFDTAGGKGVPERVKIANRNSRSRQNPFVVVFIAARLDILLASGQKIGALQPGLPFEERFDEKIRNGNGAPGILAFRGAFNHPCPLTRCGTRDDE